MTPYYLFKRTRKHTDSNAPFVRKLLDLRATSITTCMFTTIRQIVKFVLKNLQPTQGWKSIKLFTQMKNLSSVTSAKSHSTMTAVYLATRGFMIQTKNSVTIVQKGSTAQKDWNIKGFTIFDGMKKFFLILILFAFLACSRKIPDGTYKAITVNDFSLIAVLKRSLNLFKGQIWNSMLNAGWEISIHKRTLTYL